VETGPETEITLVPHTHWDREWYAPFAEFRERLVEMMDGLLDLGDRGFPHFHLDGQVAMIDDYLDVRPEREPDLRRLADEGRLSLGPWFTQMDEFLVSGESHVRNLEVGLARAQELGPALEVGYMPDQFGHIGQMPQILRMGGVDRAVVWRGVPSSIDRTSFRWEASDGSAVTTEYLAFGYFNGEAYRRAADPQELAEAIQRSLDQLGPFRVDRRVLVMVGSDHSGPDASLPDRLDRASAELDGVRARVAGLTEHLRSRQLPELPVWRGELRSSARAHLLPNVISARVRQKRERGRVESLLERYAEPLAALVPLEPYPVEALERAWRLLLWNGAHDSACGCSHDQVARDVDARFAEARSLVEDVIGRAMEGLAGRGEGRSGQSTTLRFNPSPFEREGVPGLGVLSDVTIEEPPQLPVELSAEEGWILADGIAFTLRDEPDVGDLYNFCPADEAQVAAGPDTIAAEDGRIVAGWDGLTVRLGVRRREGEPFLRLEGAIENARPDHRLRLHVRLPEPAEGSLAGSPFELAERPLRSEGGELEAPSPTWPARHVVQAGGIAAYHEGVFEYEVSADELAVTLLRCVGTISREHLSTRPFAAGPDVATPEAQMLGRTGVALGLRSGARRLELLRDWERFALPIVEVPAGPSRGATGDGSLLRLEGGAVLSSVRLLGEEVSIRLWNPLPDREVEARIDGRSHVLGPAKILTVSR
jgi:hypothetical protein